MSRKLVVGGLAPVIALLGSAAHAQSTEPANPGSSPSSTVGEIVVTAERRAQTLESVPAAISAVSGAALEEKQVLKAQDLQTLVPSISLTQSRLGSFKIAIRGIGGSAGDNLASNLKVAVFLDDVYLARQGAMDPALFDLDRIEVLRGPQGTLYGKNAVAGAINIYTVLPGEEFRAKAAVDIGNYNTINSRFLVSGPLGEDLSGKLVLGQNYHSGYGENLTTGRDVTGGKAFFGRAALRYSPGDWDFIGSVDYEKDPNQPGRAFHIFGTGIRVLGRGPYLGPPGVQDVYNDYDNRSSLELAGGSFKAIHNGADVTLTSISGLRWSDRFYQLDLDNSDSTAPGARTFHQTHEQSSTTFSQEFRVASADDGAFSMGGRLFWTAGAYFFYEDGNTTERDFIPTVSPIVNVLTTDLKAYNYALYGQATYDITEALSLTAGLRYNVERKEVVHGSFGAPVQTDELYSDIEIAKTWKDLSPKVTLSYDLGATGTLYATYARGFLSGAVNSGPATAALAATEILNPEYDDNFEVGVKKSLLDRRLYVGLSAYYIKYKDLQVQTANEQGIAVFRNAARAVSKGFELEVTARPTDALTLSLSYAYTDARYKRYCAGALDGYLAGAECAAAGGVDNEGARLQYYYPEALRLGFEYAIPMASGAEVTLRGDWARNTRNNFPGYYQDAFTLVNGGIQYRTADGRWTAALWGKNLANEKYATGCLNLGRTVNGGQCSVGDPRTYGVSLTWNYR
ncbi:TonB-dependent receptor [Phenylobacterium sp.]|uniref:TonB-dependent receptor n=1 Tax=Phenylobacterium sp. TaxID=1871053 RepID=UPI0028114F3B|nr:TonB-dependent receptor [Phenylobacterium sp.]